MGATLSTLIRCVLDSSRDAVPPTTGASASMAPPSQRPPHERSRSEAYIMGVKALGSEMTCVNLSDNKTDNRTDNNKMDNNKADNNKADNNKADNNKADNNQTDKRTVNKTHNQTDNKTHNQTDNKTHNKTHVSVKGDALASSPGTTTQTQGTQKSSVGVDGMARIMTLSPVQTVVLGPDLKILEISKSYLAATGLKRKECIGQDIFDYARQTKSGVCLKQLRSELEAVIGRRETRRLDPYKDAQGKAWRTRFVPIYDEEERELLYVVAEREEMLMKRTVSISDENYTNETYRIMVNNVKDYAIFMLDPDGYISNWNTGARILKQYKAEEIIGRHFSTFYGEEDNANHKPERELEICMKEGEVEDEGWRYRKDGTRFWASVTIAPVYKDGVHIGFSKVTRDLTERKAAETRLIEAFEEASKLKSDFLANMSHEIRTPMHGMLTACSLLMDAGLSVEQKELAHIIRESGAILLQVINDILDYSKLASGSFTVNSTQISIPDITNAVANSSRATRKPGVEIGTKLDTRLPKNLQSDPLRFRQVLGNLVGNAVKFTEKGSINIVTTLKENDDDGCTLLTEVADTGIGVPNHAVDALFTPFAQFESSATKRYKGTGLGLSICKSLVELMGGTIGFRPNDNGTGSTFWFTTRLTKISKAAPNSPQSLNESPSATLSPTSDALTKNILVVEDNSINRTIMVKLLKNYGFSSIDVASHGLEALNLIKSKPLAYSLVLMDINMPVMDGMKATEEIRGMGLDVPIIAMTANALKGDEERFLKQGMNDYVAKPVDRKGVLRVILRWLEH